ncbi:MAG TPA: hypothetical protein VNG29_03575 [Candidatus Paceibacterota bacterium]|nr:hypothetical protein [Candidatus Paceibacterota bacterium]
MKQSTKRFASLLIGLLFLFAALIVYFELIAPAYQNAQSAKAQYLSQQSFLTSEEATIKKVQDLIANYQSQSQVQDAVSSALPLSPDIPGAITQITGVARQSALAVQTISVQAQGIQNVQSVAAAPAPGSTVNTAAANFAGSLEKPIGTILLSVKMSGQYENIKQFISLLATNIRLFDPESVDIEPIAAAQGVGSSTVIQQNYNFTVNVATYYQGS